MTWSRGIGFVLLAGLVAALGPGRATTATERPSIGNGGSAVVGMLGSIPGSLDPDRPGCTGSACSEIWQAMCLPLYDDDPQGNTIPLLASGPSTISKDRMTVTIPLRKGILFNDGTPFNAAAVATTFQRDITLPGSARKTVLGQIASATPSGPYTVQLHMASPNTALLGGLTNEHPLSPTQLASTGNDFGSHPVCVGPFMFQSAVPGQSVTLVRSPYFYDKQDVHLDKLVYQYEPSDTAAVAALEAGDIQALDDVPREELKAVEQNGFRVIGSISFGAWRVGINIGNVNGSSNPYGPTGTPIANPLVREAFELAIDRKTLNKVVFGGTNVPGCTPLSPAAGDWYTQADVPCTPYDPVQARKLVQQSGVASPTVQMAFAGDAQTQLLAEFIQAEEQSIGITLVLTPLDSTTLGARESAGNYQTYISSPAQVKADPDWIFVSFMSSTGGLSNVWGESNASLARDLNNARKAVDPQVRGVLYRAAQKVIVADRPVIYLVHILNRAAVASGLLGVEIRPDGSIRPAYAGYRET